MTLFAAVSVIALLDVIGQKPSDSSASGAAAVLTLSAPHTVRGGVFFQSRIEVRATQAIDHPRLVFADGWVEGMQVNSTEPAADSESSRDGRLVLSYGQMAPGDVLRVWFQFEVNPTNVGHRSYGVELDDETRALAHISHNLTVLP